MKIKYEALRYIFDVTSQTTVYGLNYVGRIKGRTVGVPPQNKILEHFSKGQVFQSVSCKVPVWMLIWHILFIPGLFIIYWLLYFIVFFIKFSFLKKKIIWPTCHVSQLLWKYYISGGENRSCLLYTAEHGNNDEINIVGKRSKTSCHL